MREQQVLLSISEYIMDSRTSTRYLICGHVFGVEILQREVFVWDERDIA